MSIDLEEIKRAVKAKKYYIRAHARNRMTERGIEKEEVEKALMEGEILEEHPQDKPYPKCLIMGFVREREPLYVSCSFDGEEVYIVTVHWMDPEEWIDPWTRRR